MYVNILMTSLYNILYDNDFIFVSLRAQAVDKIARKT